MNTSLCIGVELTQCKAEGAHERHVQVLHAPCRTDGKYGQGQHDYLSIQVAEQNVIKCVCNR